MTACPNTYTDLTNEEAHAILEPYFEVLRDEYFMPAGMTLCRGTRLRVDPSMHDTNRHFAACQDDGRLILVAPEVAELPDTQVMAILAHELGHACDFLYPGQFAMRGEDEPAMWRDPSELQERHWRRGLKEWQKRDDDLVELTADAIAHRVMGERYGYRGPCLIQDFSAARLRPVGLR